MPEASRNGTETELALAVTQGVPAAKWARTTGVPSITAWRWATDPVILPFAAMPVSLGAGLGNRACGETEFFRASSPSAVRGSQKTSYNRRNRLTYAGILVGFTHPTRRRVHWLRSMMPVRPVTNRTEYPAAKKRENDDRTQRSSGGRECREHSGDSS
jgi:hypothetical protein